MFKEGPSTEAKNSEENENSLSRNVDKYYDFKTSIKKK